MADDQQQAPAPYLNEIGATISGIFRDRLWKKENQDFIEGPLKQYQKRIQQASMVASQSTMDNDPNGEAVANVPKEMILAATDLKMAGAQYPNNPMVAATADQQYQTVMNTVKELMGVQSQQSTSKLQEGEANNQNAAAQQTTAENKAGKPAADVGLIKGQTNEANARAWALRHPQEKNGNEKPTLVLGLPPGTINSAEGLYSATKRWLKTPSSQGGPDQTAIKLDIDSTREDMAFRRYGDIIGKPIPGDLNGAVYTAKSLAERIPFEDATNEVILNTMKDHIPFTNGSVSANEVDDKFGFLKNPGQKAGVMGKPGKAFQEPYTVGLALGDNKMRALEVAAGKPINTVNDAIKALPANVTDLAAGDGPVSQVFTDIPSFFEKSPDIINQLKTASPKARAEEVDRALRGRAYELIDDTMQIPRGVSDNDIPEAAIISRDRARKLADAAVDKYLDQILMSLGLAEPKKEEPKPKGYSLLDSGTVRKIGDALSSGPTAGILRGVKSMLDTRDEVK